MSAFAPSNAMSTEAFLATGTTFVVAAALFVAVRIGANSRYTKSLVAGDYMSMFATILLVANLVAMYITVKAFTILSTSLMEIQQLGIATGFVAGASMWASKAPILLLYIRLFGVERWMRVLCYSVLSVTGVYFLLGATIPICPPKELNPMEPADLLHLANCSKKSSQWGVASGSVSVATDLLIFCLPLRVILKMQLALTKKIGLIIVFLSGVFAIAASAVSLHYKTLALRGRSSDMTVPMICTVIECAIAIIVSCAPGVHCFGRNFAKSAVYSRIRSAISHVSLSSRTGASTDSTKTSKAGSASSSGKKVGHYQIIEEDGTSLRGLTTKPSHASIVLRDLETGRLQSLP